MLVKAGALWFSECPLDLQGLQKHRTKRFQILDYFNYKNA